MQHLDLMELIPLSAFRSSLTNGDAMLVLSGDLNTILWLNEAAAQLLGGQDAAALTGSAAQLSAQTHRQIAALDLQDHATHKIMLRLAGGLHQSLLPYTITPLEMPAAGQPVLLMTTSATQTAPLSLPHYHAAQIDADGAIIHADAGFAALDINNNTISDLMIEAQSEPEGFIRRRVRAGQTAVPAAMIVSETQDETPAYLFIAEKTDQPAATEKSAAAPAETIEQPEATPEPTQETSPARFVWKVDAQSRFTEVSPEFAGIVGGNAADIISRKFSDVARVFGFDDDGTISVLLGKQETWSGKRIFWPVQGTDQRVPVDLAALPVFARDKEFSGFSGFGVIYPALAETDPEAIGLSLVSGTSGSVAPANKDAAQQTDDNDTPPKSLTSEKIILMEALRASQARSPQSIAPSEQEIIPLKPAPLAEIHPARPANGLSQTERNAFREIADRLRREVLQKTPKSNAVADNAVPENGATAPVATAQIPAQEDIPYLHDVPPANHNQTFSEGGEHTYTAASERQDEEDLHVLSALPVPVLIHNADRLHFANQAFFDMTGYVSLDDLRHAGGIDALFAQAEDSDVSGMILCLADGSHKVVEAHLQSVPWQGNRALMLSLLPERILQADNDDRADQQKNRPALVSVSTSENPVHQMQTELALHSAAEETEEQADRPVVPVKDERASPDFQALQTQIDELTSILDTATDGVVIIGQDGKIRSLNQSAAALFGYDIHELAGKSFAVLFAIESQRAAIDYIHGLSGDGVASLLNDGREVIGREAQGRFIPLFMTIGKLPASKGYCAVMRDITQWKRAEEELTSARQEAERASTHKTEFLARISHEIRTPLNAIIGFSELMAEEKFGPIGNERYREYLRDIHRSGNHVLALVNDLLDISKIEAGALDLEFEAVALNDALAEAVALMQPQANRERVIIRSSFSAFLPDIVADARSIRQVALNLLSNAIRFTGQGGQVIVSTSYEPDGHVVMRVRDTGIGMNQNELEQALKPFRQVSSHNNQLQSTHNADIKDWRQQGTGLGLPLTKAMVEANRAQFTIESIPDQGTTVEIIFPPTRVLAE